MAVRLLLKSTWYSAWLGWKIETNWADPLTFAGYYLLRPFAGLLIVGFIFLIGSFAAGSTNPQYFTYLFLGQISFIYVAQITIVTGSLIHEERSKYETLRSLYVTPTSLRPYLLGRALSAAFASTTSMILTLLLGTLVFSYLLGIKLEVDLLKVNYPALGLSILLGVASLISVGLLLSAVNILSTRLQFTLSEYVSGIFFLLGDVIFPPSMLPAPFNLLSSALPITYYMRAVRASVIFGTWDVILPNIGVLLLLSIVMSIIALISFSAAENRARHLGILDRKSEY